MVDTDLSSEPIVTASTANRLIAATTELRGENGILLDIRLVPLEDCNGIEAICVGALEDAQFVVITNDGEIGGPIWRDVIVMREGSLTFYKIRRELTIEEGVLIDTYEDRARTWASMVDQLDVETARQQLQRFDADRTRCYETIEMQREAHDLHSRGEITDNELQDHLSRNKIRFSTLTSEDDEEATYEKAYASLMFSALDYRMQVASLEDELDDLTTTIVKNSDPGLSNKLQALLTEAHAWRVLSLIDRAQAISV